MKIQIHENNKIDTKVVFDEIEIDIEDPMVGWQMEEVFGTNHTCWGKQNVARHNDTVSEEELQRRN